MGMGRQCEWVVMGALLALDTEKPIVIHCRGGIEYHRECVGLLIDILGMNHKIMLHGWNGCGEVVRVWLGLCNSVWFGISGKLRGREGWWDQVPLERCLIETDAPYLGGGREDIFLVRILGMRGWGDFVRGLMYQGKWWGQFWHRNLGIFMG